MKYVYTFLGILGFLAGSAQQEAKIFQNFKADKANSILPDFSYVGYHCGERPLESKKNVEVFDVINYGAIPDDIISDKQAIMRAIAAAEKAGGGIVFFPKGKFLVQEDTDSATSIWISKSNIIFRGSGSGKGGTELFMKNPLKPADPEKMWTVPPLFIFGSKKGERNIGKIVADSKTGSFEIMVDKSTGLKENDWIMLEMKSKDLASIKLDLGNHEVSPAWKSLNENGIELKMYYQVKKIAGNQITLVQPLAYPVNSSLDWKVSKFNAIEEVGIENIAFAGNWKAPFVHHRSWLDDSGFTLVNMRRMVNSWMKNCRFTNVSIACVINSGANISVLDCVITGNGGHEAVANAGGTNILLGRIIDEASMWHSVGTSKTSMNTVVWRVTYPVTTCFESHASQPRNTLLDNVIGGLMQNRGGGALVNMPNHMRNLVMWNYTQTNDAIKDFEFWPSGSIWWKIPNPIIVGFSGKETTFQKEQVGYMESIGKFVTPGSLYESQLKLRLGRLPDWMIEK